MMDDASSRVVEAAKRKLSLGDGVGAVALLRGLRERQPGDAEIRLVLGQVLLEMGDSSSAMAELLAASEMDAGDARIASALSLALIREGDVGKSYEVLSPFALAADAPFEVLLNFSQACLLLDRGEEGAQAAERALALQPNAPAPAINRFLCRRTSNDLAAWQELYATALSQNGVATLKVAAAESLYLSEVDEAVVLEAHREVARRLESNISPTQRFSGSRDVDRPLRIGFLSPDFRRHPVASFTLSFLRHWDREAMPVTFFSLNPLEDEITAEFEGLGTLRRCAGMKAPALAAQIMTDKIDVLVDLAGYTVGGRPEILAMKPAPVVVTGIGYPASLQMERLTGELTDVAICAAASTDWPKPLLVSTPFLCYDPVTPIPPISDSNDSQRPFRWGAACNAKKINRSTVELWGAVLNAHPSASFVCACPEFSRPSELERVKNLIGAAGVLERTEFIVGSRDYTQYMLAYNGIDAVLDTFPFNGATTTLDALLMGVPVLTLRGESHRARVGAGLLSFEPGMVATSSGEFVARSVELSGCGPRDKVSREVLRQKTLISSLSDGRSYARKIEVAIREAWKGYCLS